MPGTTVSKTCKNICPHGAKSKRVRLYISQYQLGAKDTHQAGKGIVVGNSSDSLAEYLRKL